MRHDRGRRRGLSFVISPAVGVAAAVLAGGGAVATWWVAVEGRPWQYPLAAVGLALLAAVGVVSLSRARATRQLRAAADAFAERELARHRRRKAAEA